MMTWSLFRYYCLVDGNSAMNSLWNLYICSAGVGFCLFVIFFKFVWLN